MHFGAINSEYKRLFPALVLSGACVVGAVTAAVAEESSAAIQPGPAWGELQPITIVKARVDPLPEALAMAPDPGPPAIPEQRILELDDALVLVLSNSPMLEAYELEYGAMDALAWQAGRRPNPELELEFADFGGNVDATGVRELGTSVTYRQTLERGDKREKRVNAAASERELVSWDRLEFEHGIQGRLRQAYVEALIAQHELARIEEYCNLAQRVYEVVEERVAAGRAAQLELAKLDIEIGAIELERDQARRAINLAYLELAALWGADTVDFDAVAGDRLVLPVLENPAVLEQALAAHPALMRWDAEYQTLCAARDLEFATGVPDLAVFGGIGYANANEETVFNVGVAIDLPVHDRNAGAISAASSRLEQVELRRRAAWLELSTELTGLIAATEAALQTYNSYELSLLPAAREHYELTNLGYTHGKFDLLEVLDAERTIVELQTEQAAALAEYRRALTGIEALLGISIEHSELTSDESVEDNND